MILLPGYLGNSFILEVSSRAHHYSWDVGVRGHLIEGLLQSLHVSDICGSVSIKEQYPLSASTKAALGESKCASSVEMHLHPVHLKTYHSNSSTFAPILDKIQQPDLVHSILANILEHHIRSVISTAVIDYDDLIGEAGVTLPPPLQVGHGLIHHRWYYRTKTRTL